MSEGHICIEIAQEDIPTLTSLVDFVTTDPSKTMPFVLDGNRLYLHRYWSYEMDITKRILAKIQQSPEITQSRKKALLDLRPMVQALFPTPDWQLMASIQAITNNLMIITGGPGTGKTTTVSKILTLLFTLQPSCRVALAAPTGKAAVRMEESLRRASEQAPAEIKSKFEQLQPYTLHKLLGTKLGSIHFKHNEHNPLPFDLIVVDETSMVDIALFAKLLNAIGEHTRLILLGDRNQLSSVEAGSIFGDLCLSVPNPNAYSTETKEYMAQFYGPDVALPLLADPLTNQATDSASQQHPLFGHMTELQYSHRFNDQQGIGKFSKAVLHGDIAEAETFYALNDPNLTLDNTYNEDKFREIILEGYRAFIQEPDIQLALKKMNQLKVLCAVRQGKWGIHETNKRIESILAQAGLLKPKGEFYANRPIIVTANDYNIKLFNGDIGLIRPASAQDPTLRCWFEDGEGGIKSVLPAYIPSPETVFAMTIHKSQGSEFDEVLVLLPPDKTHALLTRELLYTAVTRAKTKAMVQCSAEVLKSTISQKVKRSSGLNQRIK